MISAAVGGGLLEGFSVAASGLKVNLAKSALIPVGDVVQAEGLAVF
jgi:hypothetical protein